MKRMKTEMKRTKTEMKRKEIDELMALILQNSRNIEEDIRGLRTELERNGVESNELR